MALPIIGAIGVGMIVRWIVIGVASYFGTKYSTTLIEKAGLYDWDWVDSDGDGSGVDDDSWVQEQMEGAGGVIGGIILLGALLWWGTRD